MDSNKSRFVILNNEGLNDINGGGKIAEAVGFIVGLFCRAGKGVNLDQTTRWP